MNLLIRTGIAGVATTVGAGLFIVGVSTTATGASSLDAYVRPEDTASEWFVADDDDGLDDNSRSRNTGNTGNTNGDSISAGTRMSRSGPGRSGDATRSGKTAVSRDRDRSIGDKTRDFTRDGPGDRTRDLSANFTNDRSRNDTR